MIARMGLILPLAGWLLAAPVAAEPALRTTVTVSASLVTAGDLITVVGDNAQIPLFRAPDPGQSGVISAERVKAAAARHGIAVDALPGQRITVWRASRVIDAADVETAIRAKLQASGRLGADYALSIERPTLEAPVHLDPMVTAPLAIEALESDRDSGRVTAVALVRDETGQVRFRERIVARIAKTIEVPVLARATGRGAILSPDDIAFETRTVPPATAAPPALAELVGKSLRRRVPVGTTLTPDQVTVPNYVARNDMVTMVYQAGRLVLSARGRALADGVDGALIPVLNLQSKRIIEAEVSDPGVVVVRPKDPVISVAAAPAVAPAAVSEPVRRGGPTADARAVRTSTITVSE